MIVSIGGVLATYIHHLDPVALPVYGVLKIRWYGLAYLAGFVAGYYLLKYLSRRQMWAMAEEKVGDFIAAAALFGVFLGGRLGSVLFYQLPEMGWEGFKKDPWVVLRVWEGGMASHGGILGLVIFTWVYARKHQVNWARLGDGLCVVAPLGLLFGRIANFINGELYGRVAKGCSWAMKFPDSLKLESPEVQQAAMDACVQVEPQIVVKQEFADGVYEGVSFPKLVELSRGNSKLLETLGAYLPERYPSQLIEAACEGGLLFAILWGVRVRYPKAPDGLLTGLFFLFYPIFRIFGEQFREPDAPLVGCMTMGQFMSLFMFLFAAGFLWYAWGRRKAGEENSGRA